MKNTITAKYLLNRIMVVIPCVLTAQGVVCQLKAFAQLKGSGHTANGVNVINSVNEAFAEIMKVPDAIVILNISKFSSQLSNEIAFINWCQTVQPRAVIVAYVQNHELSIINYISALGVRVIISQYETASIFTDLIIKSFSATTMLYSPIIKNILSSRVSAELTACEVQVLGQLFLGNNVSQVAQRLGRDIRTVSAHKRHAMEKLGLRCEKDLYVLGCALSGK